MLKGRNLRCVRNGITLYSELNFTVNPGEVLHVVGANGSGKSSLLHMMLGLLAPEAGEVLWHDAPIHSVESDFRAQVLYLGHKIGIKNNLTALENMEMAAQLGSRIPNIDCEAVLHRFGLQKWRHTVCRHLSAGQRQRVALTRLLMLEAKLWVLDEPFTAIDQESSETLQQVLLEHTAQGGAVVLTSHHALALNTHRIDL